jgi:hypothetical protein
VDSAKTDGSAYLIQQILNFTLPPTFRTLVGICFGGVKVRFAAAWHEDTGYAICMAGGEYVLEGDES